MFFKVILKYLNWAKKLSFENYWKLFSWKLLAWYGSQNDIIMYRWWCITLYFVGYYLYVSSKNNQYKKATIISKVLSGTKCLSFAYIMNGRQMGVLDIFGKTTKGQWWLFKLSNKLRGHQGWDWKRARFTVGGGGSQTYWVINTFTNLHS